MVSIIENRIQNQGFQMFSDGVSRYFIRFGKSNVNPLYAEAMIVQIVRSHEWTMTNTGQIQQKREEIKRIVIQQTGISTQCLFRFLTIVVVPDGISDFFRKFADELEGIWFVSEHEQKVYVFENQGTDYGNLYPLLCQIAEEYVPSKMKREELQGVKEFLAPVTLAIVFLNLIVYLLSSHFGDVTNAEYMHRIGGIAFDDLFFKGEYWRLFSSMFLHFGMAHFFNNMISLIFLGSMLEKRIGSIKYTFLYLLSGLVSGLVSAYVNYYQYTHNIVESYAISAGASGAIFGVIGALIAVVIQRNALGRRKASGREEEEISLRSIMWMAFFSLFQGFTTSGVDNWAHIGGIVFGFLFGYVLARKR